VAERNLGIAIELMRALKGMRVKLRGSSAESAAARLFHPGSEDMLEIEP